MMEKMGQQILAGIYPWARKPLQQFHVGQKSLADSRGCICWICGILAESLLEPKQCFNSVSVDRQEQMVLNTFALKDNENTSDETGANYGPTNSVSAVFLCKEIHLANGTRQFRKSCARKKKSNKRLLTHSNFHKRVLAHKNFEQDIVGTHF